MEQLSCEKVLNFVLLDNYFTDLFTEVQIRHRKFFKFGPGRFVGKTKLIPAKNMTVLIIGAVNKKKGKEKFAENHGNDISRRFNTLPNFLFTTSETKRGY